MVQQLLIGSLVVTLSVAISAAFIGTSICALSHTGAFLTKPPKAVKTICALIAVTLWLLFGLSASVWIWAAAYLLLGLFAALEPALYFAVVSFTTLGFGDVIIAEPWRLLSGICAANGLLLFGLNTAFLVEFMSRLHKAQSTSG